MGFAHGFRLDGVLGSSHSSGPLIKKSDDAGPIAVKLRGIVMLVTRHKDQSQFSRYFYPWSVVGWIRLAEDDEREQEVQRGR